MVAIAWKTDVKKSGTDNSLINNKKIIKFFIAYTALSIFIAVLAVTYINNGTSASVSYNENSNAETYDANQSYYEIKEIQGVPAIGQFPELPSGCEAVAAAMLLRWAGINISKEDVADVLPKGPVPVMVKGKLYGGNPEKVFVGNPYSNTGYGVYRYPILWIIDKFLPGKAVDLTGKPFEEILKAIDRGSPVIMWSTLDLSEIKSSIQWFDENGKKIDWKIPEHVYLLIGYSKDYVIVNDPYSGKRQNKPIKLFKERWESMGRQAVTISNKMPNKLVVTRINPEPKNNSNQKMIEEKRDIEDINNKNRDRFYNELKTMTYNIYIFVENLFSKANDLLQNIKINKLIY